MLILPHTMSKRGRPACKQSSMAASRASAKVDSPDTRLACLQLRLILMTTRLVSPNWGCSKYMSATNRETIFVDLWAMSSTSCGKRATMHWLS